ncbi:uncharacterized protein LOC132591759 [Zootoca vivipara]|uniref:uncharacterized protein LOC132591759 n=1 Tax=Zootoca vivipara TaxID=8524 RepID=UPI00293BD8F3|nr:uncharacterized protein LOC132591759 [Zootoca vivipara]
MAERQEGAQPPTEAQSKRVIKGPSQALRSPPAVSSAGRVQAFLASIAGDAQALASFGSGLDALMRQTTMASASMSGAPSASTSAAASATFTTVAQVHAPAQSEVPPRETAASPSVIPESPPELSSSDEDNVVHPSGVITTSTQVGPAVLLPSPPSVASKKKVPQARGPAKRQAKKKGVSGSGGAVQAAALPAPVSSLVVSPQVALPLEGQDLSSTSSAEDALPVPDKTSLGGKRRHKKRSKKRAKRRKDDTSATSSTEWLNRYPNAGAAAYLRDGFSFGFQIPVASRPVARNPLNQKSVREMSGVARRKIDKEIALNRIAGPFEAPPFPNLHLSPLGIVPKKAPGEFRLIHNLSHPKGSSVNDMIPPELCSVKYASLDQAVEIVRKFGPGALLAKCDIESAFRLLPIHPSDFWLLGFQFEGAFYFDKAMPMGCSVACAAFESFSTFLEWALRFRTGLEGVTHYLDDFLLSGASNTGDCVALLQAFAALTKELGVPLAGEKTEGPTTRLTYLGILLDTVAQTSSLPPEKIVKLKGVIEEVLSVKKVTLRQLQSLLGHLNFACRVVAPGRPFCARLNKRTVGLRSPHQHVRLHQGEKADLRMWLEFLNDFNGVSLWQDVLTLHNDFQVNSDAAGSLGFGLFWNGRWCAQRWPPAWQGTAITRDLTFLEFFPIVVAVHLWVEDFRDHRICFWSDNHAVVDVLAKQSSRSPRVSALLRAVVLQCLRFNIAFTARFIPGLSNDIADALSRFQMERFWSLVPDAQTQPEYFPERLWNLGSS